MTKNAVIVGLVLLAGLPAVATPAVATPAVATPAVATPAVRPPDVAAAPADADVVATAAGPVRGAEAKGVRTFSAIPYAAPPTGERRWRPPAPVTPWTRVRDATRPAPRCAQNANPVDGNPRSESEDCLYLNVTTPAKGHGSRLPVMVWIHGGGFAQGAAGDYDPSRMVTAGKVIVVTVNYRLGVLGFLGHPGLAGSATFGLQDQQAALRWVRRNAAAFGGDPGNVTLSGESSGAFSTCAQLTSPQAAGLFDKAIMQSGSCSMRRIGIDPKGGDEVWLPRATQERAAAAVAKAVGCPATLECLRKTPVATLLGAQQKVGVSWSPAYGTELLPLDPGRALAEGRFHRMPVMSGGTADENTYNVAMYFDGQGTPITKEMYDTFLTTAFGDRAERVRARYPHRSPSSAWAAIGTDRSWACDSMTGDRQMARRTPVYRFEFADRTAQRPAGFTVPDDFAFGAYHGADLAYLFDGFGAGIEQPLNAAQRRLSAQMIGAWTRFAATGDPGWRPMDGTAAPYVRSFATAGHPASVDIERAHNCDLWR